MPFYPFLGEGSPAKIDYREGTLILTSLLEDLDWNPRAPRSWLLRISGFSTASWGSWSRAVGVVLLGAPRFPRSHVGSKASTVLCKACSLIPLGANNPRALDALVPWCPGALVLASHHLRKSWKPTGSRGVCGSRAAAVPRVLRQVVEGCRGPSRNARAIGHRQPGPPAPAVREAGFWFCFGRSKNQFVPMVAMGVVCFVGFLWPFCWAKESFKVINSQLRNPTLVSFVSSSHSHRLCWISRAYGRPVLGL